MGRHRAEKSPSQAESPTSTIRRRPILTRRRASLSGYPRVVWIAGGLLKGASVDDLVVRVADRLAGAVLIGRDRGVVAEALSRHAADVPVIRW